MIYFIQAEDGGPIKIGTTARLAERLKQLCRESGKELRVLAVVEGGYHEEQALHGQFCHLKAFGEWFEPGDDLIGFIVEEGQIWEPPADEPEKRPNRGRTANLNHRCTPAWRNWLNAFAHREREPVIDVLAAAVDFYARHRRYEERPPEH